MNRIGDVVRVAQGLAVVRCPDADSPPVGTTALTEDLAEAGEVVEIFGPVERPYCAVAPGEDVRPADLVGAVLYSR